VMMNAGIVTPDDGYLAALVDMVRAQGALVAFDEVKTGFTVAAGGATEHYGVRPDIVCLAKALGGGLPVAAIGGTAEVMERIADGTYDQVGTFNGNPLGMAAARAALTDVLTPVAYRRFDTMRELIVEGCETAITKAGLPAHVVAIGAKGCVTFTADPVRNFRDFLKLDERYSHCHWLFQHNGGVFLPPWGKAEQWLLSAQHTEQDAELFVGNFTRFVAALTS
jgi:glutamate-1-semialdehyde 2,1-aminomutase